MREPRIQTCSDEPLRDSQTYAGSAGTIRIVIVELLVESQHYTISCLQRWITASFFELLVHQLLYMLLLMYVHPTTLYLLLFPGLAIVSALLLSLCDIK